MLHRTALALAIVTVGLAGCGTRTTGGASRSAEEGAWRGSFDVPRDQLAPQGRGKYALLEPGATLTFADDEETLVITVLPETRVVDGVTTRVVEERETVRGALKEISRNFFAIHPPTGDLYYFGEEVDIYKDGKIVEHEGAWLSGAKGAKFGLLVPGAPAVGMKYYQEVAPGVAMDRAEVVSVSERVVTPAGTFANCLHIAETTPLERGTSHKWFAPGVGLVKDGDAVLTARGAK